MERIANKYSIYPKYYIVGSLNDTTPWSMSLPCGAHPMRGEVDGSPRYLYKHSPNAYSQLENKLLLVIENQLGDISKIEKALTPFIQGFTIKNHDFYSYLGKMFSIKFVKVSNQNFLKYCSLFNLGNTISIGNWKLAPSRICSKNYILTHNTIAIIIYKKV